MSDNDKSYLEIKVTFLHVVVLLVGVILIGIFLFVLGFQAGKTSPEAEGYKAEQQKDGQSDELQVINKDDPDKIEEVKDKSTKSEDEEVKLHIPPQKTPRTEKSNENDQEEKTATMQSVKVVTKEAYFSIQVGAFHSHELAQNYSKKFSRSGYATDVSQAVVNGKTWYRVRVGNYETRNQAKSQKRKLERLENKKFRIVKVE